MLGRVVRPLAVLMALASLLPLRADAQVGKDQVAQAVRDSRSKSLLRPPSALASGDSSEVARMNEWSLGFAAGLLEGTFIRFAAEMARALNDGDEMRIMPIVSPGANDNIKYLLYVKGVDSSTIERSRRFQISKSASITLLRCISPRSIFLRGQR